MTTKNRCYRAGRGELKGLKVQESKRLRVQKSADFLGEAIRVLDVGEVGAIEFDIAGAGNVGREKLAVGRSGGRVLRSGNNECGSAARV